MDYGLYAPEGFGTADCILTQGNTLYVIDFKYGKGVPVSAKENPQMMLYALGAYEACKILYRSRESVWRSYSPDFRMGSQNGDVVRLENFLEFGEYVEKRAAVSIYRRWRVRPEKKHASSAGQENSAGQDPIIT